MQKHTNGALGSEILDVIGPLGKSLIDHFLLLFLKLMNFENIPKIMKFLFSRLILHNLNFLYCKSIANSTACIKLHCPLVKVLLARVFLIYGSP